MKSRGVRFACLLAVASLAVASAAEDSAPASASPFPFEGTWRGIVTAPNATTEIGFAFRRTDKGLLTSVYMPAMAVHGAPFGPAKTTGETLTLPPLATTLRRDGDRLVGTFGLSHLPVELRRGENFPPAPPPVEFPSAPAPAWTVALGAETWASPTVYETTVYLGSADGKFRAIDATSGRVLWTWSGAHPLFGAALVTSERVCFLDSRMQLIALRRVDGVLAWQTSLHDEQFAGGPLKPNETYNRRTAVPLLHEGMLYVGSSDGGIYAIDPAQGSVRWRHAAKTKIYASPGRDGRELLFAGLDGTVLRFDPIAQKETARLTLPGPLSAAPVVSGDVVLVGCRDYMLYGLNRHDLSIAWKFSFWFSWVESAPAVVDGIAYIGGSDFARITALDPASGRARWSTRVYGLTWGSPLVVGDTVYAGTSAQSDAIIKHTGGLLAMDGETGRVKWRHVFPLEKGAARAGILGSIVRAGDYVIGAAFDGTVTAYRALP